MTYDDKPAHEPDGSEGYEATTPIGQSALGAGRPIHVCDIGYDIHRSDVLPGNPGNDLPMHRRKAIGVIYRPDARDIAVCDDGSCWTWGVISTKPATTGWIEVPPIPGSIRAAAYREEE